MTNEQSSDLLVLISELFAPAEVSLDSTLDDLEATSIDLLRLMILLQNKYNIALSVGDMFTVENVGELIQLVGDRITQKGLAPT